jgi:PIN domain nuclease of toxin-antitoxin system
MSRCRKVSGLVKNEIATRHAHIYLVGQRPHKLSANVLAHLQSPTNVVLLSVASIWEMQIKHQLGKLPLRLPLTDIIEDQRQNNGIILLPNNRCCGK